MGKKKVADEVCRVCRSRVGRDPFGFVRFADGQVACLRHPGILAHAVASRQLVFKRNDGDARSGKYLSVDTRKAGEEDAVRRTLDSLAKLTTARRKKKPGTSLAEPVSCEKTTSRNERGKRGKGGRGDGGVREVMNEAGNGSSKRRPVDPRENLFRDFKLEERERSTRERRGRGRKKRTG